MSRIFSISGQLAATAIALYFGLQLWSFVWFPIGGGEYHAIFAYSDTGRLDSALVAYTIYASSLVSTAIALRLVGLSLSWWSVALVATGVGVQAWLGIATWQPRSVAFGRISVGLLAALPALLGVSIWFAYSRLSTQRTWRLVRPTAARLGFVIGIGVLVAPYLWTTAVLSTPFRERLARASWMPSKWEGAVGVERVGEFNPAHGVVFEGERARDLLDQCTRPAPGAVTGTWTPSSAQIAMLEEDLAHYLVRHDTGRTRESGFVMPPFHVYYRQYGGLSLAGEGEIIYVNALLPGYSTDEAESGSPPAWRRETVSVCGGWQAYFGVEYSPKIRQFRRFSYNPSPN